MRLNLPIVDREYPFADEQTLVFARTQEQFHGVMPYRDGRPVSWSYQLV